MRAPRLSAVTSVTPRVALLASMLLCVVALAPVASQAAQPTANQQVASGKVLPLVSVTCARKSDGLLRAPKSGTCRASERRVVLKVAQPVQVCRMTSRQVRLIGAGALLSARECRSRGTVIRTPGTDRILLCRSSNGALRWIRGTQRCRAGERLMRFRNAPPYDLALSNSSIADRAPAGSSVGTLTARDRNGDPIRWTLVRGTGSQDNGAFRLRGASLLTARPIDRRTQRTLSLRARATDVGGRTRDRVFTVTIEALAATAVTLGDNEIPENSPTDTVVGELGTLPAVLTGTRYALVTGQGDDNNADFQVQGSTLVARSPFDHETSPVRLVRVRSVDDRGTSIETALKVTVTDVNESPTRITLSSATVEEHAVAGTPIGALTATDPDVGETFTWSVQPATQITVRDGQLVTAAPLSHRDSPLNITVTVRDSGGLEFSVPVQISVTDVVDVPTDLSLSNRRVAEFAPDALVGTLSAQHDDGTAGLTYALVAGTGDTDNAAFTLVGNELRTRSGLRQRDGLTRNVRVRVTAADGGQSTATFTIALDRTPVAPTNLRVSPALVAENQPDGTTMGSLLADDANIDESATWTLATGDGDADNADVRVAGDSLVATRSFDHETQAQLAVRVAVRDEDGLVTQAKLTIQVGDVNEAPTGFSLANRTVGEGVPDAAVGALSATDPEGATVTFALVPDADDNAEFRVVGSQLRTAGALAFADGATRTVQVKASDPDGTSVSKTFTITVVKNAQAPTGLALSGDSVAENAALGTVIGTLSTTDPNPTDTHRYAVVAGVGDASAFSVEGDELVTAQLFDHETAPTRSVRIRTTDDDNTSFEKTFTITVTDVNEAPSNLVLSADVAPSGVVDAVVGTASATDVEGDVLSYHLVGGADRADFVINAATGVLRTNGALDRADGATRQLRIEARDPDGLTVAADFTITVVLVPMAPTDITLSPDSVAENAPTETVIGNVVVSDPNIADTHDLTLVPGNGDGDNSSFGFTGDRLVTGRSFDHEATGTLRLRVRATDQTGLWVERALTVTVTDVDEAPTGLDLTGRTIAENSAPGTHVGDLSGVDPEGAPLTWTLPAGSPFEVVGNQLRVAGVVDFETQPSWTLTFQASDGTNATQLVVTVTVTDVNEKPTALNLSRSDIDENNAIGAVIGQLTSTDPDAGDTATYSKVSGPVSVVGSNLLASQAFDHEGAAPASVVLRVTDRAGLTLDRTFTLTINDVNEAPVLTAATYGAVVGNVSATVGATPPAGAGPAQALTGSVLLASATDPEGGPVTVQVPAGGTVTTTQGGRVTLAADGQFRYQPPRGLRSNDSFSWTATDGVLSTTGTATLNMAARLIWFVDPGAAAGGNGTSAAPLRSLDSLQDAGAPDSSGDEIFVASGPLTLPSNGFTLDANQKLYGGAAGVQIAGTNLIAPGSASTLTSTGSGLALATGTSVRNLTLVAGTGTALRVLGDTTTVNDTVTVTSGTGAAVIATDGSGAVDLSATFDLGVGAPGVVAIRVGPRSGTTTLGPITSRTTSRGISLNSAGTVRLVGPITLDTGTEPGLAASDTVINDTVGGHGFKATTGVPLQLTGGSLSAPLRVARVRSNGAARGIAVSGTSGSPVVLSSTAAAPSAILGSSDVGVTFVDTTAPSLTQLSVSNGASDGLRIDNAVGNLSLTHATVGGNAQEGIQVAYGNRAPGAATITDNTVTDNRSGLVLARDGSAWQGSLDLTVQNNTVTGSNRAAILLGTTGMPLAGGVRATVADNVIGNQLADSCSATGNGIEVSNEDGAGALVLKLSNNTVRNCHLRGIQTLAQLGTASLQATITDNTVTGSSDATGGFALDVQVGNNTSDTGDSCFDVSGNTLTSGGSLPGLSMALKGGWIGLPSYPGNLVDTAAVGTYLSGRNTGSAKATFAGAPTHGFRASTCTQP